MLDFFKLFAFLRRAGRDERGNAIIIFGFCLVPMVLMTGLGIDYGMAITARAKLDAAADAASLAAVSTAKAYLADNPNDPNAQTNAITAATARAKSAFAVNAGKVPFTTYTLATPSVVVGNRTFTATVSYSASATNHFGQIVGVKTFDWNGRSQSVVGTPGYLDFYLLVDVSGSMGLPSTQDGMFKLSANNPDQKHDYPLGCMFACHYPRSVDGQNTPLQGWDIAKRLGIQLRSGAVNDAVCQLLQRAASPAVIDQYRIGIYPFITQMATLVPLTADTKPGHSLWKAADCDSHPEMAFTNLLDTGTTQLTTNGDLTTGTGSGGTHFDAAFSQMRSTIVSYGDGSSATSPKPFVFLVTDGVNNNQFYSLGAYRFPPMYVGQQAGAGFWGEAISELGYDSCQPVKDAGAIVSVLYIPYLGIAPWDKTDLAPEIVATDAVIDRMPDGLQKCASPGYFFTANSPDDIKNALNAMFDKARATQMVHLQQ